VLEGVREWHHKVSRSLDIYVERLAGHQKVQAVVQHPTVQRVWKFSQENKIFDIFCRFLITSYFLNMAYHNVDVYFNYNNGNESIGIFTLLRVPFAIAYLFNFKPNITGAALCVISGFDSLYIFRNQLLHRFVITELIVKKLAIFGSCLLLVVELFKGKLVFSGVVDPDAGSKKTTKQSVVILIARLLISSLFLYIGIVEIDRQIRTAGHWYSFSGQTAHRRPEGDGHDQIFFKLVQFLFCLPIIFGYQSKFFAICTSVSLILEALLQWNFIGVHIQNWKYYPIHARDHFFTNLGVAGGLLLLYGFGAGAYSLDSWLKKRE